MDHRDKYQHERHSDHPPSHYRNGDELVSKQEGGDQHRYDCLDNTSKTAELSFRELSIHLFVHVFAVLFHAVVFSLFSVPFFAVALLLLESDAKVER